MRSRTRGVMRGCHPGHSSCDLRQVADRVDAGLAAVRPAGRVSVRVALGPDLGPPCLQLRVVRHVLVLLVVQPLRW